jgi:catechol 2,3-dioxygenase
MRRRKSRRTTGLFHFALLLPSRHDLGVFLNYLIAIDYPLAGASDHDVSEALYLVDPEGNGIEVYADLPNEKWKYTRDGIYMTTVAIDHVSLLEEIGDYEKIPMIRDGSPSPPRQ